MNDLLKFITCGSVDDGKSTLIGHMLYDAKLLFTDQQKTLELDSKIGSGSGHIDYSLLLDGLIAEREQKITIDVAYRYFSTEKRSFIVADTPGHEEYTRNMAVGASFADLAVILVDVSKGIVTQTNRHIRVCSMMGIRHFVFALNKMDTVGYSQDVFTGISSDIADVMESFEYDSLKIIPLSATNGDNLKYLSSNMDWYKDSTLLDYLETVDVSSKRKNSGFCMPVQRVSRPDSSFRGFQGEISTGKISIGDTITVHPGKESASVAGIYEGDRKVDSSSEGHAVTISLNSEIDISRGCVIENGSELYDSSMFEALVFWMDDDCLTTGKGYWLKIGTCTIPATVASIKYQTDVNTGEKIFTDNICKNDFAVCEIITDEKISFDLFSNNKDLGSFILIDRVTNMTSACGTISKAINRRENLFLQNTDITREIREKRLAQEAITLWFTGLSGSGKSTIANALEKRLFAEGKNTMLLDGDNVRMGLNRNLGFSRNDRMENLRRTAEVAKLMNDAGLIVISAFISPFAAARENAREIIGDSYIEVFVNTPLEVCEERDVKGLYKSTRENKISDFTGISSGFEPPEHPDIVLDTVQMNVEECVDCIIDFLKKRKA